VLVNLTASLDLIAQTCYGPWVCLVRSLAKGCGVYDPRFFSLGTEVRLHGFNADSLVFTNHLSRSVTGSSPIITVSFGRNEQLLGRDFSLGYEGGERGHGKREKEGKGIGRDGW